MEESKETSQSTSNQCGDTVQSDGSNSGHSIAERDNTLEHLSGRKSADISNLVKAEDRINDANPKEAIHKASSTENMSPSAHTNSEVNLSDESSFSCKFPGCNFASRDVETYLRHEDTHVNGGAFDCDICKVNFPSYANMRRHQLYIHQSIRTFECQNCSKRFLRKEQFMDHLATHSKPRPYLCDICGSSFNYRGQLKSHINVEHFTVLNVNSCSLCDFKASSPTAVKIHYATFHLKQNMEVIDDSRAQDLVQRVPNIQSENGAIDLATVSQNFSLAASHFPSYSTTVHETILAGPSNLSRSTSNVHRVPSPIIVIDQNSSTEKSRHTSTTPAHRCHPEGDYVAVLLPNRVSVKPEPPEAAVEDSGNVQPTSTIDLSTSDVVGTTSNSTEPEYQCSKKVHRHSISDDDRVPTDGNECSRHVHNPCRCRHCDDSSSSQRCHEYAHHMCSHRHKRTRYSNDSDRSSQSGEFENEDRKVFYRATSTNSVYPNEVTHGRYSRTAHLSLHGTEAATAEPREGNFFTHKNTIVIRDIESCTLTCIYCGIIFPDQTLYLLHRSLHSEGMPAKCNLCGKICNDKYDFNSHIISKGHY